MKKVSLFISLLLLSPLALFGGGPYNLEGIQALNVLVIDENKAVSPQMKEKIAQALKQKLEKNGIKSKKEGVGTLFVKIYSTKVDKTSVVYINFGVGEESRIQRAGSVESFVISYNNEDMISGQDVEGEVYDSVVNFLMDEFLEQFHEDNEE